MQRAKTTFQLDELSLYFDTVAKDRLDAHAAGHRNAELLDLRDQMMRLSEREFNILMRTFRAAVKDMVASRDGESSGAQATPQSAHTLYNEVRPGSASSDSKVAVVS